MQITDIFENKELFEARGETLVGIHFSNKDDLRLLDASKHGEGIRGAERKRMVAYPELYNKDRVYFYVKDEFKRKEPGLGRYAYEATLKNLYDMSRDPEKLRREALEKSKDQNGGFAPDNLLAATIFENLVLENGYDGYFNKGIIIYFSDVRNIERNSSYDG